MLLLAPKVAQSVGLALSLGAAPPAASVGDAPQAGAGEAAAPAVEQSDQDPELGRLSQQGSDSGAFEFGLGAAALSVGLGLIAAGSVDLQRGLKRREECRVDPFASQGCELDPPGLIFASSGLAFGFALPALVAGALLIRRGARIHADRKRYREAFGSETLSHVRVGGWLSPRGARRGGGLSLHLRF